MSDHNFDLSAFEAQFAERQGGSGSSCFDTLLRAEQRRIQHMRELNANFYSMGYLFTTDVLPESVVSLETASPEISMASMEQVRVITGKKIDGAAIKVDEDSEHNGFRSQPIVFGGWGRLSPKGRDQYFPGVLSKKLELACHNADFDQSSFIKLGITIASVTIDQIPFFFD
jgi:hypothetical protein